MRRLKRTEVLDFKRELYRQQGGVCPLCLKDIPEDMAKVALDHDHTTGECRGLLHLGCNKTEGSVFNAVGRWGGVGKEYGAVKAYLIRLLDYLDNAGTGVIYHLHKTEEELHEQRKRRAREAAAKRRARTRVQAASRGG